MVEKIPKIIILLLLLSIFAAFLQYSVSVIPYPYDWIHNASQIAFYGQQLLEGKAIYGNDEEYPILGNVYPPASPALIALACLLLKDPLITARVLSFIMSLATGLVIFLAVRKETRNNLIATVAALFYYIYMPVTHNYPSAGSNSTYIFFSILGVYLVRLADDRKIYYAGALISLVLAAYTRQAAFYACAAACIYIFLKSPKKGLLFASLLAGVILVLFFWINAATDGWFYDNIIKNHAGRKFSPRRLWLYVADPTAYFFVPIVASAAYSVYSFCRKELSIWVMFFIIAFAEAFSTGTEGVSTNMLMPMISASCVPVGLAAWELKKLMPKRYPLAYLAVFIVAIQFALSMLEIRYYIPPGEENRLQWKRAEDFIGSIDGPILFDRTPALAMKMGKTEYLIEPVMPGILYKQGRWKGTKLVDDVKNKKFGAVVVFKNSFLPPNVREAIGQAYHPVASFEVTELTYPTLLIVAMPNR